ncbi:MAG: helix-turn-helix domain-containing protein [Acidobacteriota bacterium]
MPRKVPLPETTEAERHVARRAKDHHGALIDALDRLRRRQGMTCRELARVLGPDPRYLTALFRGEAELPLHRLFLATDALDVRPGELLAMAFPGDGELAHGFGHLAQRLEGVQRDLGPPAFCARLVEWGRGLSVAVGGDDDFPGDPARLEARLREDPESARFVAAGWLQATAALGSRVMSPAAALRLCRVLGSFAHLLLTDGHYRTAAEILDLAFRLEAQVGDPVSRARLYRQGATVAGALGHPVDGEALADRAARLDQSLGDLFGLCRSTYLQATMLARLGHLVPARQMYSACIAFLPEGALLELDTGQLVDPATELAALPGPREGEHILRAPLPRCKIPMDTEEQRRRSDRVRLHLGQLWTALARARAWTHRRRFQTLDRSLGREAGYLAAVFQGTQSMTAERLLAAIDLMGFAPSDFFAFAFPESRLPPSAVGFLPTCRERRRRSHLLPRRRELLEWGRTLRVAEGARGFTAETGLLKDMVTRNPKRAFELAKRWLRPLLDSKPDRIRPNGADTLCRILDPLSYLLRLRGDRNTAAEIGDLAFRLEAQLDRPVLRGLLFRTSTYLLNDLGYPKEAAMFARRAATLSRWAGHLEGLGKAVFLEAVVLGRLGRSAESFHLLKASERLLIRASGELRASILRSLAISYLERGEGTEAESLLARAEGLAPVLPEIELGRLLVTKARIASAQGKDDEAGRLFDRSEVRFAAVEAIPDLVIAVLFRVLHELRLGRPAQATARTLGLVSFAEHFAGNAPAEAALLEIARKAIVGNLLQQQVEEAIGELEVVLGRSVPRLFGGAGEIVS